MLYDRLFQAYGPQHWWPGESAFEVMVGAVLTQNTAWGNVEKAINTLKQSNSLTLNRIIQLDPEELARLIRPVGYFNVKTRRLKHLCHWVRGQGGIESLRAQSTGKLRQALLSVHGIGPETADDILLYALQRPLFVIDAYTRQLLGRLKWIEGDEHYEVLRRQIETALGPDPVLYNEYHALIVRHAKQKCTESRGCRHCRVEAPFKWKVESIRD